MKNSLSSYESILIFSANYSPKKLKYIAYYYAKNLKKWGATNIHIKYRGKRDLAYSFFNKTRGNYIQLNCSSTPKYISNFENTLKLDSNVLRFLVFNKDN